MKRKIGVGVRLVVDKPPPNGWDTWSDGDLTKQAEVRATGKLGAAWKAFEVLYRRHTQEVHQTIYQFLRRQFLISDHALAEDLTQDTFIQVWDNLPEKNPQSPFLPWIKVIAVNEARQYMRKWRRATHFPPNSDPPDASSGTPLDERIALQIRIEQTKQRLPKQQQIVFSLHYDLGYTPQEIADELKMKPSAVWQTLWRANVRFRKMWLKEGGMPPDPPGNAQGEER